MWILLLLVTELELCKYTEQITIIILLNLILWTYDFATPATLWTFFTLLIVCFEFFSVACLSARHQFADEKMYA